MCSLFLYVTIVLKKLFLHIIFIFCANILFAQQASVFEQITTANGLPSNYVFCVAEDIDGFMWAGTDKGLCRFNGAVWEVWDVDKGLQGNYISEIKSDRHNGLWISISEKGLYHFDITTKKASLVKAIIKDNLFNTEINNDGNLLLTVTNEKALRYKKTMYKQEDCAKEINIEENNYATDNQFYDDTIHKVTHVFNFKGRPIKNYKQTYKKIIPHFIDIKMGEEDYFIIVHNGFVINYNWVFRFYEDAKKDSLFLKAPINIIKKAVTTLETKKQIYIAKAGEGFYIIDKNTNAVKSYFAKEGLTNENINHIYQDKVGTIYLSTLGGGINVLQPNARLHFTPKQLPLRSLQMANGFYYGMANGTLYKFNNNQIVAETFIRKDALSFYITNDSLMVGSFEGFHYYSFKNNTATLKNTFRIGAGISSIYPYKNDWMFSTYGNGFYNLKNFEEEKRDFANLPFANIEKTETLQNSFAGLSFEDGLFICNNDFENVQHFNTKKGLLSNYVNTVHEYKDTLWVGGKNGISLITKNNAIKTLSYKEGFKGKIVKYIFTSNKGQVWVVSDAYLHVYMNGQLQTIASNISNSKNENIVTALYDAATDNLIVSTNTGISIVRPSNVQLSKTEITVALQAIFIDAKIVANNNRFEVSYNANNILFRFKPLDNLIFSRTNLYCKLNNEAWQLVSDSLAINFNKLRPGSYTLYTKVLQADGTESDAKAITTFTVSRPWWQRWWALVSYSIGLILSIGFIVQYINRKKQAKLLQKIALQKELENERQRISRDLHDNMGAYTSALIANVQHLKLTTGNSTDVENMQSNAEQILASLRETIWVLNNKEVTLQAFSDGFKNYCFKILKNFEDISFNAIENIENNILLTAATAIHLNKILQEAVQNTIKHANATQLHYTITSTNKIEITIYDNGKGFDQLIVKKGNGLENMQWRAKEVGIEIKVQSVINNGTTITINTL
jgi:signal transduction histidine kinase